jgi:hypothetical protein
MEALYTFVKKYLFILKVRSLPNQYNYSEYLNLYLVLIVYYCGLSFVYCCLIADDFSLIPLKYPMVIFPFATLYKYFQIEETRKHISKDDLKDLLVDLRQGQYQLFKEKLEARPELLKGTLQGKSLFYFCKKYGDLKGHAILLNQLKKPFSKSKEW